MSKLRWRKLPPGQKSGFLVLSGLQKVYHAIKRFVYHLIINNFNDYFVMKYLLKQKIEFYKEVIKQAEKMPNGKKKGSIINMHNILIDELQSLIDIYAGQLQEMSENRANLGKLQMQNLGDLIQDYIKGLGFVLFVFPFYKPGISNYVSNGQRADIITLLEETLERFKNNQVTDTPETN